MKKKLILILTSLLLVLLAGGCNPDAPDSSSDLTAPTVDEVFANYAAIGNSLTAGFMDGGLMISGQMSSFPRLIAGQLGLANAPGDMEFSQPWINSPGIGSSTPSDTTMVAGVYYYDTGTTSLGILGETSLASVTSSLLLAAAQPTPYHNLGVPGAALADVMHAYTRYTAASYASFGKANPYFDFINRYSLFGNATVPATGSTPSYETASMFGQCVAKGPSLATVWIGNNDVLGGATAGTVVPGVTITDVTTFDTTYKTMLATFAGGLLKRTGWPATIVVANIPNIADIPYFWSPATFEAAMQGAWTYGYTESDVELVRFPAVQWAIAELTAAATEMRAPNPIPADYTLTETEVGYVETAVTAYNSTIVEAVAMVNALGLAQCGLVDANEMMSDLPTLQKTHLLLLTGQGMPVASAATTTKFSLDGIHPNNAGYAMLADAFLEKIGELTGQTFDAVPTQSWDPTYGQSGSTKQAASVVPDAMRNLFN